MSKEYNSSSRQNSKRNVKKVILQGRNHLYEYETRFDDKGNNVVVKTVKTIEINRTSKIYRDGSPPFKAKGYERPTKASLLKQVKKSTTKFLNKPDEIFNENLKFFDKIEKDITNAINNTVSTEKTPTLTNQNNEDVQKRNVTPSCIKITSVGQTDKESDNLNRNEKEYFNMPPNGRIYPTKYKTVSKTFISKKNDQLDSFRSDQTWDQSLSQNKKGSRDRQKSILKKTNLTEEAKKIRKAIDVKHIDNELHLSRLKSGLDEKRNHQRCCKLPNCCYNSGNSPSAQSTLKPSYCVTRGSTQSYNYGCGSPINTRNFCPPSQGSRYGLKSAQKQDCSPSKSPLRPAYSSPKCTPRPNYSSPRSPPKHDCLSPKSSPKHACSTLKSPVRSQKSNSSFFCRDSKPCKSESEILKHLKVSVTMDNDCEELCKRHNLDHVKKNIARYACKNKSSDPVKFLVEIEKEFDCKKPELNECTEDMENVEESNSKNNLSDTDRFILKMIKQLIEFKKQSLISREGSETNLVGKSLSMSQLGKCLHDVQKDGSGLIITLRNADNEESFDKSKLNRKCKDLTGRNKNDCKNIQPVNSTFYKDCFRVCPTNQMTQTDCSFSINNSKKIKRVSYENLPMSKNCLSKIKTNKDYLKGFNTGGFRCEQSCKNINDCPEAVECNDNNLYSYISDIQPRSCESSDTNASPYLSSSNICNKNNDILERFNKLENNIRNLCEMVSSISANNKNICKSSVETMTDDSSKLASDTNLSSNNNSNVIASQESFWKEMTSLVDSINSSLNENGKNGNASSENYFDKSGKSFIQIMNQTGSNPQNIKSQTIKGIVKKSSPNDNQDHIAIVTATSINVDIPESKDSMNSDKVNDEITFGNSSNQYYEAGAESSSVGLKKVCCSPNSSKECCCSSKNETKKCPAQTQRPCLKRNSSFCNENSGFPSNVRNHTDNNGMSTFLNDQSFSIQNCKDLLPEERLEYIVDYPLNMTNTPIFSGFNDIRYSNGCSNAPIYICEVPEPSCSIVEEPLCNQNNLDNNKITNECYSKFEDNTNYCEQIDPLESNIGEAINNLSNLINELKNFMLEAQTRCKKSEEDSYQQFLSQISLPSSNIRESLKLLHDISQERSTIVSKLDQQNIPQQGTSQSFSNLLPNSNEIVMEYPSITQTRKKELVPKNDENALRSSINSFDSLGPDQLAHQNDYPISKNKINERQFQIQECKISFATDFSTIYANQVIRFVTTKNFPNSDNRDSLPMSEFRNRNINLTEPSFDNVINLKSEKNSNNSPGISVRQHLNENSGAIVKHYEDRDSNLHYNLQMDLTFIPDNPVNEDGEPSNIFNSTRKIKNTEYSRTKNESQSIRKSVEPDSDKKRFTDESKRSESKYLETNNETSVEDLIEESKSISFDLWDKNVKNSLDIIKEKFKSNSEIKLTQKNASIDELKARHSLQDNCEDSSDNSMSHDEKVCNGTNCLCMAEIEERLTNVLNDENFQKKINQSTSKNDQLLFRRSTIQRTPSGNHITEHVFTEREFNSRDNSSNNSKFKFSNFFSK